MLLRQSLLISHLTREKLKTASLKWFLIIIDTRQLSCDHDNSDLNRLFRRFRRTLISGYSDFETKLNGLCSL